MNHMPSFAFILPHLTILVFTAVCAVSDHLTRRIPNPLLMCGLFCAGVSRAVKCLGDGMYLRGIADMAAGFLLPYLLLGIFVYLKMLGGGDVKLLSVIGLQAGWRGSLTVMWYSLLAAAGVSVLIVIKRKNLALRLEYLRRYAGRVMADGRAGPYRSSGSESGEFAFAVPVLLALVVYLAGQVY